MSAVRNREASTSRRLLMYYNYMLNSIGNTALVRCREVVRFSEGPLSEARLYYSNTMSSIMFGMLHVLIIRVIFGSIIIASSN